MNKLAFSFASPDGFREALHLSRRLSEENTGNPNSSVYVGPHIPVPLLHKIWSKEVTKAVAMRLLVAEDTDIGGVGINAVIAFNHCAVEHLHILTSLSILGRLVSLLLHLVLDTMIQIYNALIFQVVGCQRSLLSFLQNCNLTGQFVRAMVLLRAWQ